MKYAGAGLLVAAAGMILMLATLFDARTAWVAIGLMGVVVFFGALPVLFGVLTRRAESRKFKERDAAVIRPCSRERVDL